MKVYELIRSDNKVSLKISERPIPVPKADEVLIKWHASSLNYHDLLIVKGLIPVENKRIPMSDGSGEIVSLGTQVNLWKTGDKVMSSFFPDWKSGEAKLNKISTILGESVDGCMCEYSCLPQSSITKIPEKYSYAESATLPCAFLTAFNGLLGQRKIQEGESILIEGTGGMSIMGLIIAKAMKANIYATSSSELKAARLKELGVIEVVNYKEDHNWGKTIFKLSNGGVDHILDVGGGSTMKQSIEALKIGGSISSIGILSGGRKGEITFPKLFFKFVNLRGFAVGNIEMQNEMVSFIEKHEIKPIIDRKYIFDELNEAFSYMQSGKHFGKIIVQW